MHYPSVVSLARALKAAAVPVPAWAWRSHRRDVAPEGSPGVRQHPHGPPAAAGANPHQAARTHPPPGPAADLVPSPGLLVTVHSVSMTACPGLFPRAGV